jgi:pyruvate dehydrogenase E1 component alpha subunit
VVDGNDVVSVAEAAGSLVERARKGGGPGYLEAVTYRWSGHVGAEEDDDAGTGRSAEDLAGWKLRDPIGRLSTTMALRNALTKEDQRMIESRMARTLATAKARALAAPYPAEDALLDWVYGGKTAKSSSG